MSPREHISVHGRLFGGNTMYEVLFAIASRRGQPFHGAAIARDIRRTDAQALVEIAKLEAIGIVAEYETKGRARTLALTEAALTGTLLSLPILLERELGEYARRLPAREKPRR